MEAFKKKFEVGKWYKLENNPYYLLNFQSEEKSYGLLNGRWSDEFFFREYHKSIAVEATDKEVEKALIEESKKRFGEDWKNAKIKECLYTGGCSINSGLTTPIIIVDFNSIWNRNGLIFYNGVWAEPLIEEKIKISKAKALKIIAKKLKV